MRSRSIVRWKSFWLGVFVLMFLGWAWLGTRAEEAMLYRTEGGKIYMATSGGGSVGVGWAPFGFVMTKGDYRSMALDEEQAHYFAPAFDCGWEEGAHIAVAYWVVVLGFLVAWGGFLMWRGEGF